MGQRRTMPRPFQDGNPFGRKQAGRMKRAARWMVEGAIGGMILVLLGVSWTLASPGGPTPPIAQGKDSQESSARVFSEKDRSPSVVQPRPLQQYWWNQPPKKLPVLHGGAYQDRRDSLGFAAFRQLDEVQQRQRRTLCKDYIKRGNDEARTKRALDDYATAVGLCPYYPKAWLYYAETAIKRGNYVTGQYLLLGVERSLKFAGNEKEQKKIAAQFYFLDAVASYNLGQTDRSLSSVENSLVLRGGDVRARMLRVRCLTDLGRYDDAREELDTFEFGDSHWSQAQAIRGVLEMKAGNLDRADHAFSEAWEYGLRSGVMENDRGRLRLMQDRPKDAIGHFKRAVRLQPDLMEARNNLAVALRRSGKDDEAEAVLHSALAINPDYAPAHFNLAELYRSKLDTLSGDALLRTADLAREHYGITLEHHYRTKDVLEHRAWVALRVGDLAAAEADLLRLSGSSDADGRVLFLLGHTKKEQGELRIAQQLFLMAIDRGYIGADVHSDLGEVLLRRKDLDGAREELEQAIRLDNSLIATRVNLCEVLMELGEKSEADRVLREAEQLVPDDPAVQAQRQLLESQ